MIVVTGLLPLRAEAFDGARRDALEMAARSRGEPGCLTYEFSEVSGSPNTLRLFEEWSDDATLTSHLQTDSFSAFSTTLRDSLSGYPHFTRYEIASARPLFGGSADTDAAPREAELGDVATRLLFENRLVKVWEMQLGPGEASALHRHDHPYLLCIVSGDSIDVEPDQRDSYKIPVQAGDVFFVPPGETERAVNKGRAPFHEILIELKGVDRGSLESLYFSRRIGEVAGNQP
jgi:quinol monooxygenase YgiN/quercetin dioxygenase-like cupin family protein